MYLLMTGVLDDKSHVVLSGEVQASNYVLGARY